MKTKTGVSTTSEEWIRKAAAAALIGTTLRQVERYASAGAIRKQMVADKHGPVALLSREDCLRIKQRREQGPVVTAVTPAPPRQVALPPLAEAPHQPRPWLTLAEAAEFSGLPASWLKRAAWSGQVEAINCGSVDRPRWRFHRDSLARPIATRLFAAASS